MHKGCSRLLERRARYGWLLWTPVVACVTYMMIQDASLNIRLRKTDYQFHKADTERRAAVRRLDETLALEAQMKSMEWLTAQAAELGLRMPSLEQVEVVRMDTLFELPLLLDAPEVLPPVAVPARPADTPPAPPAGIPGALLAAAPGPSGPAPKTVPPPAAPGGAAPAAGLDGARDELMAPL